MEKRELIEALRIFKPEEFEWHFALYSTSRSRDGIELNWDLCKMSDISKWIDTLRVFLLEKTLPDREITEYSPLLPKENIPMIAGDDELIHDQIFDIFSNIKNAEEKAPEDFVSGALPKPVGYAFYGHRSDDKTEVLFMRRTNPFITGQKTRLCTTAGGEIVVSDKPLLKFSATTDFLMFKGMSYFFSQGIEKDFELENRNIAIAVKCLKAIAEAEIVNNFEELEKAAYLAKNARKFAGFDKKILERILRLPIVEREEFLSKYYVDIDREGLLDTYNAEQCELVIDLLCGRSVIDALGRFSVGDNVMVRE